MQKLGLMFIIATAGCGSVANTNAVPPSHVAENDHAAHDAIAAAVAGPARKPDERARDAHGHPLETLELFGLRPDMKVIELAPGSGWYTAILAPVLKERGELTVTSPDPNGPADDEGTKYARAI